MRLMTFSLSTRFGPPGFVALLRGHLAGAGDIDSVVEEGRRGVENGGHAARHSMRTDRWSSVATRMALEWHWHCGDPARRSVHRGPRRHSRARRRTVTGEASDDLIA